jgi:hypothetical protein
MKMSTDRLYSLQTILKAAQVAVISSILGSLLISDILKITKGKEST